MTFIEPLISTPGHEDFIPLNLPTDFKDEIGVSRLILDLILDPHPTLGGHGIFYTLSLDPELHTASGALLLPSALDPGPGCREW